MRKDIKFMSQYFYPEPGATSELLSEIAARLSELGYKIQGLAGQPSYFGSTNLPRLIEHRGMRIKRVWSTTLNRNTVAGRVLNTFTFTLGALWDVLFTSRKTVLVAVTNPPILPWVCLAGHVLRGHRFIVVIHDLYPDIAVKLGALRDGSFIVRLWTQLNGFALRRAERVIVLGRDMQEAVAAQVKGLAHDKMVMIPNWANGREIVPQAKDNHVFLDDLGIRDRFIVQYSGNIGRFHEIETILAAAEQLQEEEFLFMFIGTGAQVNRVEEKLEKWGEDRIRLLPFQPRERLGQSLTACDVALVTLRDGLSGLAVPSKLYGILAAGKPVVVIGPEDCEAARVIKEHQCGVVVEPGDGNSLANTLKELKSNHLLCEQMGKNARNAFQQNYDLPIVVKRWSEMLEDVG